MRTFTMLLLVLCALFGAYTGLHAFAVATSAVHEIEGLICVLIVTVAASAGYIVSALDRKQ